MIAPLQQASDLAQIYQCLGDNTRLRILHLLMQRPLCVCHLQEVLGLPQVKISKHLKVLRERGFITRHRFQNWNMYRLAKRPAPEVGSTIHSLRECMEHQPQFRRDRQRLTRLPIDDHLECKLQEVA